MWATDGKEKFDIWMSAPILMPPSRGREISDITYISLSH